MIGMSHRGMFRRKVGNNFRYLHDEVPNGYTSLSHLKTLSSYSGDCVQINSVDIGFDNNIVDSSLFPLYSSTLNVWYDQLENGNFHGGNYSFNAAINDFSFSRTFSLSQPAFLTNLSDAFSFVMVADWDAHTNRVLFMRGNTGIAGNKTLYFQSLSDGTMRLHFRNSPTYMTIIFTPSFSSGTKLFILNYDGGLSQSSFSLYYNDVTTPLTPTSVSGSSSIVDSIYTDGYEIVGGNNDNNSHVLDFHSFSETLNLSYRQTAKEILEQNPAYIF